MMDLQLRYAVHNWNMMMPYMCFASYIHSLMNQSIPTGQTPRLRRLKVYERTLLYGSGGSFNYRVVCNPEIRLCGQWLNQMGFTSALSIIDTCLAQLLKECNKQRKGA
jgi:hypothetical protein